MTTNPNTSPIIQLENVVKAYTTGDGPFIALNDISLDVYPGEFLGIMGKSGAGKTTLLNMISGVSTLTSGDVRFFEGDGAQPISIHTLSEDDLALWRGQHLGIVYQSFELMPSLTLLENVMLPQDFAGTYHPLASKKRALELLEMVDIVDHAYKIPAHISGGQKQRVAIARALVNDPPLIIADEPTGNLDTVTAATIFAIFENLVAQGKTIIMVSHDQSLAPRFSRQRHIADGRLVEQSIGVINRSKSSEKSALLEIVSGANPFGELVNTKDSKKVPPQTVSTHPAIVLKNVVKTYENAAGRFTALKGIDLEFEYGKFISIVGKSGCGKSTLLNMITGIDHPTSGDVIIAGERIYDKTESQRALWRGQNMGVVFQFFQLLPTLTLLENTMLPMDYCNVHKFNERPARAMELLERVGLAEQAHKLPANVSSGQQQSAAIARSLATDPAIILADEPTGNLDSRSAEVILSLFEQLAAQGKTVLIVTHDPSITKRTDQTVILSDGEVIDQTIVQALPFLDHPQMLAATHQTRTQVFAPGETIIRQGQLVDHFYMVSQGEVEVVVNTQIPETQVALLGPGQFFGEVSLTTGQNSIASVRAIPGQSTKVAMISKDEFLRLVGSSPKMQAAFDQVARIRMEETHTLIETHG